MTFSRACMMLGRVCQALVGSDAQHWFGVDAAMGTDRTRVRRPTLLYGLVILLMLQCVDNASTAPGSGRTVLINVNQVGYLPDKPKTALIHVPDDRYVIPTIELLHAKTGKRIPNFSCTVADGRWFKVTRKDAKPEGFLWTADFTGFRRPGKYRLRMGDVYSHTFAIGENVYDNIGVYTLSNFYQVQKCGVEILGWHRACHLDDGLIYPRFAPQGAEKNSIKFSKKARYDRDAYLQYWNSALYGSFEHPQYVDLIGGIHDSAGLEKHSWVAGTGAVLGMILTEFDVYDEWDQATHDDSVFPNRVIPMQPDGRADLPQLVRWVNDWVIKMQIKNALPDSPVGELLMTNVFNDYHDGSMTNVLPQAYQTDNLPGTLQDNRIVFCFKGLKRTIQHSLNAVQSLAVAARAFSEPHRSYRDAALARYYLRTAQNIWKNIWNLPGFSKGSAIAETRNRISAFNAAMEMALASAVVDGPGLWIRDAQEDDLHKDPGHYLGYVMHTTVRPVFGREIPTFGVLHSAAYFIKYFDVFASGPYRAEADRLRRRFREQLAAEYQRAKRMESQSVLRLVSDLGKVTGNYGAANAVTNRILDYWALAVGLEDPSIMDEGLKYLDFIFGKTPSYDYCWVPGLGEKYPVYVSNNAFENAAEHHPEGLLGVLVPGLYADSKDKNITVTFHADGGWNYLETFEKHSCRYLFATAVFAKRPRRIKTRGYFRGFPNEFRAGPMAVRLHSAGGKPDVGTVKGSCSYGHTLSAVFPVAGTGFVGFAYCVHEGQAYYVGYDAEKHVFQVIRNRDGGMDVLAEVPSASSCFSDAASLSAKIGCSRVDLLLDGKRVLTHFYDKTTRPGESPTGGLCGVVAVGTSADVQSFSIRPGVAWDALPKDLDFIR